MPSQFSIQLEVKFYIKNYLLTLYGPREPICFPKKSDYNNMIIRFLNPPPPPSPPKEDLLPEMLVPEKTCPKPDLSSYDKIEILLPNTNKKNLIGSNYLSRDDRERIRKEIDLDFYCDYRAFIRERMTAGINRKDATVLFMEVFNIQDEHLSFSAFYRDYNRQLQRRRLMFCKSEE